MKTQRKTSMKLRSINPNDAQESTNINLIDRMKTIQGLRTEFGNEKEALRLGYASPCPADRSSLVTASGVQQSCALRFRTCMAGECQAFQVKEQALKQSGERP